MLKSFNELNLKLILYNLNNYIYICYIKVIKCYILIQVGTYTFIIYFEYYKNFLICLLAIYYNYNLFNFLTSYNDNI